MRHNFQDLDRRTGCGLFNFFRGWDGEPGSFVEGVGRAPVVGSFGGTLTWKGAGAYTWKLVLRICCVVNGGYTEVRREGE